MTNLLNDSVSTNKDSVLANVHRNDFYYVLNSDRNTAGSDSITFKVN